MALSYGVLERLLSEPRTPEAEQRLVASIKQIKPTYWLDMLEQSAGLTILALPDRSTFTTAVRSPRHDVADAVAHLVLFGEHKSVAAAAEAGLEHVASRPAIGHLSGVLATLLAVVDQEIGGNLLQTQKDWFRLDEAELESYFRGELQEALRKRDAN